MIRCNTKVRWRGLVGVALTYRGDIRPGCVYLQLGEKRCQYVLADECDLEELEALPSRVAAEKERGWR